MSQIEAIGVYRNARAAVLWITRASTRATADAARAPEGTYEREALEREALRIRGLLDRARELEAQARLLIDNAPAGESVGAQG